MSAAMAGLYGGHIFDPNARIDRPAAEIHILKPYWIKGFVHAPEAFPDVAADHEERARRLFHRTGLLQIAIQAPIPPVDGIRRPQPVQAQQFEDQRLGRRQIPDRKPGLRPAGGIRSVGRRRSHRCGTPRVRDRASVVRSTSGLRIKNRIVDCVCARTGKGCGAP